MERPGIGRTIGRRCARRVTSRSKRPAPTSCQVAAVRLFEARIRIAAIVHDAFLVEGPVGDIERIVQIAIKIMEDAGRGYRWRAHSCRLQDY